MLLRHRLASRRMFHLSRPIFLPVAVILQRSVTRPVTVTIAIAIAIVGAEIAFVHNRSDHTRSGKMKALQSGSYDTATGIGCRYDKQRSRGHACEQRGIGQAHDGWGVYNNCVDFLTRRR